MHANGELLEKLVAKFLVKISVGQWSKVRCDKFPNSDCNNISIGHRFNGKAVSLVSSDPLLYSITFSDRSDALCCILCDGYFAKLTGDVITFFSFTLFKKGYIKENAIGAQYLHFPRVAHYAKPGMYFDPNGEGPYPTFLPLAPVVLHAVVIMGLNTIYRHIAEWLTTLENHRTDRDYQNSLILKRIFFDGFDCYIALFYLAFCKFDINALRNDLFGL
jgi:hypothetical protein